MSSTGQLPATLFVDNSRSVALLWSIAAINDINQIIFNFNTAGAGPGERWKEGQDWGQDSKMPVNGVRKNKIVVEISGVLRWRIKLE
ncbi:hypothetical protein ACFL35_11950 [Candidatus Riflebacteria bacterium]